MYIVYEINLWDCGYDHHPKLENSLFGAVKLATNADVDKYKYTGYGIRFNRRETFSVANGFFKNILIFGVDMSFSVNVGNKEKNILIQGLHDTTLTAEKTYSLSLGRLFLSKQRTLKLIQVYYA